MSAGARFRAAVAGPAPLPIAGTINAYAALLAEQAGFRALYVSGAGIANASFGLPDLGMVSLAEALEDVRRITGVTALPVLVDADTGYGDAFNIARATREMIRAGAGAMHIEDQALAKRCGHRPNKAIVASAEMCDRVRAAVDARTDAFAREGLDAAIERSQAYVEAGADMIFAEALTALSDYTAFCRALDVPVLANMTEFGVSPGLTAAELAGAGVGLILYPLSAFRAMSRAALDVYEAILRDGTQRALLDRMQTREELYATLGYHDYERKLDELFASREGKHDDG